jgi:hypothetical protein
MRPAIVQNSGTPVFELKPLAKDAIDAALGKAEHYRLLNQPKLAESICLDILEVEPGNQKASIIMLLALTDQFSRSSTHSAKHALSITQTLKDDYARIYYSGIVNERLGAAALASSNPGSDFDAYEWYREAMDLYEKASALSKDGNNDPVLRWNTCARIIMEYHLRERPAEGYQPTFE